MGLASIRRSSGPGARAGEGGQPATGWSEIARDALAAADVVGLYVHFPFCSVHCPYCDFAVDARADIPHDRYAEAVVAEVTARAAAFRREGAGEAPGPRLVSIYFGGGTPGLWQVDALARVIGAARTAFGASEAIDEITVEANPGEVTAERAQGWRAAGVNRVSLGLQSLDDHHLAALGRNHDAAAGASAVSALRAAGIPNLSLDLMFALPEQTLAGWAATLDGALGLGPDHVSAYALTVERATPFGARARRGELVVPDSEVAAAMQEHARDRLAVAGLKQYEVSSYARAGRRAVHNSLYWSGAPYLGVGASASSFRPLAAGGGWRFSNPRATETYLRSVAVGGGDGPRPAQIERRTAADLENEAVWLALRTADGLERAGHAARFGADPVAGRERAIESCVAAGWLELTATTLRPTSAGLLFADEIATRLWR